MSDGRIKELIAEYMPKNAYSEFEQKPTEGMCGISGYPRNIDGMTFAKELYSK